MNGNRAIHVNLSVLGHIWPKNNTITIIVHKHVPDLLLSAHNNWIKHTICFLNKKNTFKDKELQLHPESACFSQK